MLTPADESLVATGVRSCDHDYLAISGISGEPFLRHGLLSYFDGRTVEVAGFPLDAVADDADLAARTRNVLDEWLDRPDVRFIYYYGPVPIDLPLRSGWSCQYSEGPFPWNVEVSIDLTRPIIQRTKVRQDVRRAVNRGIQVTASRRRILSHEHISLMTTLVDRADMMLEDVCNLVNGASMVREAAAMTFDAWLNGRLVGFSVAHQPFHDVAFVVAAAFDRECRGCSDAIYAEMLRYYRDAGVRTLGFGYATDEGLFKYKTKWGTPIIGTPFHQRIWGNAPEEECLYWPWQLLRRKYSPVDTGVKAPAIVPGIYSPSAVESAGSR